MKIGMVGLGQMGANMTPRLLENGHHVVAFDLSDEARAAVGAKGAETAATGAEMVGHAVVTEPDGAGPGRSMAS
jgi:6-phosphogluconate dehydrogenase